MLDPAAIPKAELHLHLEGAAPAAFVAALAARKGRDLGGLIRDGAYVWRDFTSFLAAYDAASAFLDKPEDYEALTRLVLEDLADQNALYAEFFISPDHAAAAGLAYEEYLGGIIRGIAAAEASRGITARLIPICVRNFGAENARRIAGIVARHPHPYVTGFGMAGEERLHHPRDFAPAFDLAREAGLRLTAHAGEFAGAESVAAALDHLGVERIGHGARAVEDPALVRRLAAEGIHLESCPVSNVVLQLYPSVAAHPFGALRAAGVKLSLSTDDPAFFGSSLTREYREAAAAFGLDAEALRGLTRMALEAAFCDEATRAGLLKRLDAPLQAP